MVVESVWVWVPAVMMGAAMIRSTFGFGDALFAMPLLLLLLSAEQAATVVAVLGLLQGMWLIAQERREIDWGSARTLLLAAACGVPAGLVLVKVASEAWIEGVLGLMLIGHASRALLGVQLPRLVHPAWRLLAGFCSGLFGAAYNFSGPPVVLYGSMAGWSPERFRATLQGFFVPLGALVCVGQGVSGYWSVEAMGLTAAAIPALMVGMALGRLLRGMFDASRFERALHVLLLVLGALTFRGAML